MLRLNRSTFPNTLSLLLLLSLTTARPVWADDLTGMAHDDPKDLIPPSMQTPPPGQDPNGLAFQPLPYWSRGASMPALPQALKPMGKKVVVLTTPPVAAPQPLAPPKDAPVVAEAPKPKPAPAPAPAQTPALIAVSPFLQWIKANPQAAADQARQQAGMYQAPSDPNAPTSPVANGAPNGTAGPGAPTSPVEAPYWLPPLIDSSTFGPTGGSAAIYSQPQR